MSELLGSSFNSKNGWRWLNMMKNLSRPPPMDLPSERMILSLKTSPYNQHCKPSLQVYSENNAVTEEHCAIGGIECIGQVPKSAICSESFLIDIPKERRLPPLKNKPRNGVVGSPLQHPATQCYT